MCKRIYYRRYFFILTVSLFFSAPLLHGQKYNFVNYNIESGLAQSQAYAITQDSMHHLWIATLGGISRFDGKTFSNFTAIEGLLSNNCKAIKVDRYQNIWVGSQLGLSVFNGTTFRNYPLGKKGSTFDITNLEEDKEGRIWALYNGEVFSADLSGYRREFMDIARAVSLGKAPDKKLLIATEDGRIFVQGVPGNKWDRVKVSDHNETQPLSIRKIISTHAGFTFIVSNKGLLQYDGKVISNYPVAIPATLLSQITSLLLTKDSSLWIGTHKGVIKFHQGQLAQYTSLNGFTDHAITGIFLDREENIWFSSSGSGILKFINNNISYLDESDGMPNPIVVGIAIDHQQNTWFGTYGGGLSRFDGKQLKTVLIPSTNPRTRTINFCVSDPLTGSIWIGTNGGGLWTMKQGKFEDVTKQFNFAESYFFSVARSADGSFYFGTSKGLYHYAEQKLMFVESVPEYITSLYCRGNDSVYIGTATGVILLANKSRVDWGNSPVLKKSGIYSIAGYGSSLYMGSADNGLFVASDGSGKNITQVTKRDGLSSNTFYSLAFDKQGVLWAATGFFINRIHFKKDGTIDRIKIFGKSEGIYSAEGNMNSILVNDDGTLWFGTNKGAYKVKSNPVSKPDPPMAVFLKGIRLFSLPITETRYFDRLNGQYSIPVNLRLPYKKNHLTFEFQGISLTNPEDVEYQYMITGLDNNFSKPLASNSVIYSNIPPGHYTLIVRTLNKENQQITGTLEYSFEIKTPFHHTIYFKILLIIILILMGILLQSMRSVAKNRRRRKLEKIREEEQLKVRKRTAEDFHDEMGNKLTRITLLADIMKKKGIDNTDMDSLIGQIKENAVNLYNGTNDIIWSLSEESSNLQLLLTRIKDFGIDLFQNTNVVFEYDGLDEKHDAISLSPEFSRNLIMICKEGMNNALKYSGAKNVYFYVHTFQFDSLEISIRDNGKGFKPDKVVRGHGIDNMQQRAKRLNASLQITTPEGGGTNISILFRIP